MLQVLSEAIQMSTHNIIYVFMKQKRKITNTSWKHAYIILTPLNPTFI